MFFMFSFCELSFKVFILNNEDKGTKNESAFQSIDLKIHDGPSVRLPASHYMVSHQRTYCRLSNNTDVHIMSQPL